MATADVAAAELPGEEEVLEEQKEAERELVRRFLRDSPCGNTQGNRGANKTEGVAYVSGGVLDPGVDDTCDPGQVCVYNKTGSVHTFYFSEEFCNLRPGECLSLKTRFMKTGSQYGGAYYGVVLPRPEAGRDEDSALEAMLSKVSDPSQNEFAMWWRGTFSDGRKSNGDNAGGDNAANARSWSHSGIAKGSVQDLGPHHEKSTALIEMRFDFSGDDGGVLSVFTEKEKENGKIEILAKHIPADAVPFVSVHSTTVRILSCEVEGRSMVKSARKR